MVCTYQNHIMVVPRTPCLEQEPQYGLHRLPDLVSEPYNGCSTNPVSGTGAQVLLTRWSHVFLGIFNYELRRFLYLCCVFGKAMRYANCTRHSTHKRTLRNALQYGLHRLPDPVSEPYNGCSHKLQVWYGLWLGMDSSLPCLMVPKFKPMTPTV